MSVATAIVFALVGMCSVAPLAFAEDTKSSVIVIAEPVVKITTPTVKTAAFYTDITNTGSVGDTLLKASTPAAEMVELHETVNTDGVMKMQSLDGMEIPAGETIKLVTGGSHVMLIGFTKQLADGETLPITLTFEKAGDIVVDAPIKQAGGDAADSTDPHAHH